MKRIVTYRHKPARKRSAKPANAMPIVTPIVTAKKPGKRRKVWQDNGEPVPEETRDLVRRMTDHQELEA